MAKSGQCKPWEHRLSRRQLLGGVAGAAVGMGALVRPAVAKAIAENDKQVLFIWLDGGMSQLESWDPKPDTQFGGPFRAIKTSLPGVHVCELMPRTAKLMDKLTLVRSVCTQDNSHSAGVPRIQRGDPPNRGVTYPYFGSGVAKLLGPGKSNLPPYVWVKPGSGGFKSDDSGFLSPKYGALAFGDGKPPENLTRPDSLSAADDEARNALRERLNQRYAEHRRGNNTEASSYVFDMAQRLMARKEIFDEAKFAPSDVQRYGTHEFGRHMLVARKMLEAGVRFVKVNSYGWDTHGDNFNGHASLVPRVDQAFAAMIEDLHATGLIKHTLVILMSEFGRTPRINGSTGRDHWPEAWTIAMAGCGLVPGAVHGQTNDKGTFVKGDGYDIGALFHTWYTALGVNPVSTEFWNGDQPLPIAHPRMNAIKEVLA